MKEINPKIYAFETPASKSKGFIKIGYTKYDDVNLRIKQQFPTSTEDMLPYTILLDESATRKNGTTFKDKKVHKHLVSKGFIQEKEWITCTKEDALAAIVAIRNGTENRDLRTKDFKMRPEQKEAVLQTAEYFENWKKEKKSGEPKFLWNAKMRFGKTFTAYQLALKMGWKSVLILTFKPAVETAWEQDAMQHIDFENWQYISKKGELKEKDLDSNKPIICFGSFQAYLKTDEHGEIKRSNEWVHCKNWDCIIFDEYHFGSWRERAKALTGEKSQENLDIEIDSEEEQPDEFDTSDIPITANHYLYLSGTPFRAIDSGEFTEEAIYNWSYNDEQEAKRNWHDADGANPYEYLPQMNLLTYEMPEYIKKIARDTEFNEFDLNKFFETEIEDEEKLGSEDNVKFIFEEDVKKWLRLIKEGEVTQTAIESDLKRRHDNPADKYTGESYLTILNKLSHTLWFLPSVAACNAMGELLKQDPLYAGYKIIVAAGKKAGIGSRAKKPVDNAMTGKPLETKTITLTCGKLTTGVTLPPLSGVFMLRNLTSPETYFQTAFRAQNKWVEKNKEGKVIYKKDDCYIIDFAPNRALKQIVNYVGKIISNDSKPASERNSEEKELGEFIHYLPIISYRGGRMNKLDVASIMHIAHIGMTDKYITRVWRNSDLINLNKGIIKEIMDNPEAMRVIDKIEAFIKTDKNSMEIVIAKTEEIEKMKREKKDKKAISKEEKELKKVKKQIEEKIKKFVSRIPVFMYLTDYREKELQDVIERFDIDLFKKVTGINKDELRILTDIGVFNKQTMDIAIGEFKRYEDKSFDYIGKNAGKATP